MTDPIQEDVPVSELDTIANYIMAEIPGEPSRSEGAGTAAVRIIKTLRAELEMAKDHADCHLLNHEAALDLLDDARADASYCKEAADIIGLKLSATDLLPSAVKVMVRRLENEQAKNVSLNAECDRLQDAIDGEWKQARREWKETELRLLAEIKDLRDRGIIGPDGHVYSMLTPDEMIGTREQVERGDELVATAERRLGLLREAKDYIQHGVDDSDKMHKRLAAELADADAEKGAPDD